MKSTCPVPARRAASPATPTTPPVDVLDAPLPQLLNALDVQIVDSTITDPSFFGAFVEHRSGRRVLSMPTGRSAMERDTAARMLLAEGLGLDAPPVPVPLEVART